MTMKVTLKYTETITLTTGALGVFATYFFAANGMFDPNITGVGHQPMYYDQYMALYNHYTVIASKCVGILECDPANTANIRVGLLLTDDTTYSGTADMDAISEANLGKVRSLMTKQTKRDAIAEKWSARHFFGGSVMGNDNLTGDPTHNPAELSYYMFCIQSDNNAVQTCRVTVEIEFIAILTELKDVGQS